MGRDRNNGKAGADRDGRRFLALPHVVLESPGYRQAGHVARSLLIDIAQQYTKDSRTGQYNNGRLVACDKYLKPMGWRSHDVVTRALRDLVACGLLVETRKGSRPNRSAWYALTWYPLNVRDGLDIDPKYYDRGAYNRPNPPKSRGAVPIPPHGIGSQRIAPPQGECRAELSPSHGAMRVFSGASSIPPGGGCLEKPSVRSGGGGLAVAVERQSHPSMGGPVCPGGGG